MVGFFLTSKTQHNLALLLPELSLAKDVRSKGEMMAFKQYAYILAASLALAGCETTTQYTSGADFLSRYQDTPITQNSSTNLAVKDIAAVEPDLRFPARIGLARIGPNQRLMGVPFDEAESWRDAAESLGPSFGTFLPVSPLIANSVSHMGQRDKTTVIDHIRRGAARQHLDYVIAYEVSHLTKSDGNALRLTDLTVLGLFVLPSRNVKAEATASAILLDVRNGYPYLTGTTFADETSISTVVGRFDKKDKLKSQARQAVVAQIAKEFADGLEDLKHVADGMRLAENRAEP